MANLLSAGDSSYEVEDAASATWVAELTGTTITRSAFAFSPTYGSSTISVTGDPLGNAAIRAAFVNKGAVAGGAALTMKFLIAYTAPSQQVEMRVYFYNSALVSLGFSSVIDTAGPNANVNSVYTISSNITSPATAAFFDVEFIFSVVGGGALSVFLDGIGVLQGSNASWVLGTGAYWGSNATALGNESETVHLAPPTLTKNLFARSLSVAGAATIVNTGGQPNSDALYDLALASGNDGDTSYVSLPSGSATGADFGRTRIEALTGAGSLTSLTLTLIMRTVGAVAAQVRATFTDVNYGTPVVADLALDTSGSYTVITASIPITTHATDLDALSAGRVQMDLHCTLNILGSGNPRITTAYLTAVYVAALADTALASEVEAITTTSVVLSAGLSNVAEIESALITAPTIQTGAGVVASEVETATASAIAVAIAAGTISGLESETTTLTPAQIMPFIAAGESETVIVLSSLLGADTVTVGEAESVTSIAVLPSAVTAVESETVSASTASVTVTADTAQILESEVVTSAAVADLSVTAQETEQTVASNAAIVVFANTASVLEAEGIASAAAADIFVGVQEVEQALVDGIAISAVFDTSLVLEAEAVSAAFVQSSQAVVAEIEAVLADESLLSAQPTTSAVETEEVLAAAGVSVDSSAAVVAFESEVTDAAPLTLPPSDSLIGELESLVALSDYLIMDEQIAEQETLDSTLIVPPIEQTAAAMETEELITLAPFIGTNAVAAETETTSFTALAIAVSANGLESEHVASTLPAMILDTTLITQTETVFTVSVTRESAVFVYEAEGVLAIVFVVSPPSTSRRCGPSDVTDRTGGLLTDPVMRNLAPATATPRGCS